jgi:hypothetical protein
VTDLPRLIVATVCLYEASAILTRRHPTVSALCWRRRLLIPVILCGLAVHLLRPPARLGPNPV